MKTFAFKSRDATKTFWKFSIENHAFFKLRTGPVSRSKELCFITMKKPQFENFPRTRIKPEKKLGRKN